MSLCGKFYGSFSLGDMTESPCGQRSAVCLSHGNVPMRDTRAQLDTRPTRMRMQIRCNRFAYAVLSIFKLCYAYENYINILTN